MREAADIVGDEYFRAGGLDIRELLLPEPLGNLGMQQAVTACRTAAEMRIGNCGEFESGRAEQRFSKSVQALSMLQRTGRVEGDNRRIRRGKVAR